MRSPRRRALRAAGGIGLWLLFCGLVFAAVDIVTLVRTQDASLHQAQADLKESLNRAQAGLAKDPAPLREATVLAASARAEAAGARDRLDADWLVRLASHIPAVRSQVDATRRLDTLVIHSADVALRGETLVYGFEAARRVPQNPPLLDVAGRYYIAHQAEIQALADEALGLPGEVRAVDRAQLLGPLRQAYERLDAPMQQVSAQADSVRTALRVAPIIFGKDHPSRYLLLFADNTEIRPGGGYIGTFGVTGFDRGVYHKPDIQSVNVVEAPLQKQAAFKVGGSHYVQPPDWLIQAFPQFVTHSATLGNAAQEVSWPDDARLAEHLYQSETGHTVDGVIQIDPTLFSYLLEVTGPVRVRVPGQPEVGVSSGNVADILVGTTRGDKSFLGVFQEQMTAALQAQPAYRIGRILKVLQRASEERHLMIHMDDPELNALITKHHLDRPIPEPPADGILPVYANNSGDKVDQHVDRVTMVTIQANGRHHVDVGFANHNTGVRTISRFRELIRFYLPPSASHVVMTGFLKANALLPLANPGPADLGGQHGWRIFGGWYRVFAGQTGSLALDYQMPPVGREFSFTFVKQPGLGTYPVVVRLEAPGYTSPDGGVTDARGTTWHFDAARDVTVRASSR